MTLIWLTDSANTSSAAFDFLLVTLDIISVHVFKERDFKCPTLLLKQPTSLAQKSLSLSLSLRAQNKHTRNGHTKVTNQRAYTHEMSAVPLLPTGPSRDNVSCPLVLWQTVGLSGLKLHLKVFQKTLRFWVPVWTGSKTNLTLVKHACNATSWWQCNVLWIQEHTSTQPFGSKLFHLFSASGFSRGQPSYLLVIVDGSVGEAVVVEETHLLVEEAVHDVRPGVLPLDKADQLAVQGGAQVHGPVVTVQSHLEKWQQPVRAVQRIEIWSDAGRSCSFGQSSQSCRIQS